MGSGASDPSQRVQSTVQPWLRFAVGLLLLFFAWELLYLVSNPQAAIKIIFGTLLVLILAVRGWWSYRRRSRRSKESGFRYVYVNPDGSARELTADEQEYLNTPFHGADGARPYIKFRYESLTPDGRIVGFLERRQLPAGIEIQPPPTPAPNSRVNECE